MRILLLGPPGSGKGTQGDLIEGHVGFPRISSGDLLRDAVQKRTPLGLKAEAFMNRGELVSDDVVIDMIRERIAAQDCRQGFILDGFPRTLPQAERLTAIDPEGRELVLDIQVPDQAIITRLSARRICSGCGAISSTFDSPASEDAETCAACGGRLIQRDDDQPDVIKRRLDVYHTQTQPLAVYYRSRGVFFGIDGQGTVEEVFQRVMSVLKANVPEALTPAGRRDQ